MQGNGNKIALEKERNKLIKELKELREKHSTLNYREILFS